MASASVAKESVGADGKIHITTNYPDIFPALKYSKSDELRRRLEVAFDTRAYPKNRDVLKDMMQTRYEIATLQGLKDAIRAQKPGAAVTLQVQREGRLIDFLQQDAAGYSDEEIGAAARVVHGGCRKTLQQFMDLVSAIPGAEGAPMTVPKGYDPERVRFIPHHLCHAASTYYASGFSEASILTVDGSGEEFSTFMWHGVGDRIKELRARSATASR